jgi:hypothetical protein
MSTLLQSINPSRSTAKAIIMSSLLAIPVLIYWLTKRDCNRPIDRSTTMSPDTVSTLFPDRPIRPLPKRRLRERLSPEVADSIKYPASTLNSVPLFQYPPYTIKDDDTAPRTGATSPSEPGGRNEFTRNYTPRRNGVVGAREDESGASSRSTLIARPSPEDHDRSSSRAYRSEQTRQAEHQLPPSAPSSVDGYDSFENTNNKKKRKIPSAGDAALGGAYGLNSDMGSHSLPGAIPLAAGIHADKSHSNGAGIDNPDSFAAGSPGFSGSGRGRLGRSVNGRSPLRTLSDGNNTWAGRPGKGSAPQWASSGRLLLFFFSYSSISPVCTVGVYPSWVRRTGTFLNGNSQGTLY